MLGKRHTESKGFFIKDILSNKYLVGLPYAGYDEVEKIEEASFFPELQLDQMKETVKIWNERRKEKYEIVPCLSKINVEFEEFLQ